MFQFTRTGDTTAALTVTYTVHTGGSDDATPDDDYEALSGTVTILAGDSTATVEVVAAIDLIDPGEVVSVEIAAEPEYTVGTNDTAQCDIIEDLTGPATLTAVLNECYEAITSGLADLPDDLEAVLTDMSSAAGAMGIALGTGNPGAFATAYGAYTLLDLNMGPRVDDAVEKAEEIIAAIKKAAAVTEGDAFRIAGLKDLAGELKDYLTDRLEQIDNLIADLEALSDTIAGPNPPEPLVTGLEAFLINLRQASDDLSEQIAALDGINYTPTNPSNSDEIEALNEIAEQIDDAVSDIGGVVEYGLGELGAIQDQGALILGMPDPMSSDTEINHYQLNLVSPFANGYGAGEDETPGLVAQVTTAVDALLDLVEAPPGSEDGGALDLADAAEDEYDVADALRLKGICAKLEAAADHLRDLLAELEASRDQLIEIGLRYYSAGFIPPAQYWSALSQINAMISGVETQLQRITTQQQTVMSRLEEEP